MWWNTSLSPPSRRDRSTEKELSIAVEVIERLLGYYDADIVALGEMSPNDVEKIKLAVDGGGYQFIDGTATVGRSNFDTCIIYKSGKIKITLPENLTIIHGRTAMKLGQKYEISVDQCSKPLYLIVSHWPSRLWCSENDADRDLLGLRLRDIYNNIIASDNDANVIFAGDYNDEPFASSLARQLLATRDKELASTRSDLIYNPFWRHLSRIHHNNHTVEVPHGGSYYYQGGKITKWHTFDQLMFSSSFLGQREWGVCDEKTGIINIPVFTNLIISKAYSFDHLPVIGTIERI